MDVKKFLNLYGSGWWRGKWLNLHVKLKLYLRLLVKTGGERGRESLGGGGISPIGLGKNIGDGV